MTPHDRYQAFMHFQPVDRPPLMDWGPWESTLANWIRETRKSREQLMQWGADCDPLRDTGVDFSMIPPFDEEVIGADELTFTKTDRMGLTYRQFKLDSETSMPEYVGAPVRDWDDWKQIRQRFDPTTPGRYPADWNERIGQWNQEHPILRLYGYVITYYGGPSLFGFVRMLLGAERALYAFHDEPDLVHDMMETIAEFTIAMFQKALREAPVTYAQFWEDMAFRGGPLISPDMFRKFMMPRYKRITELLRKSGVDVIFVDSDGDVSQLIPLWLESGINGVYPMEQAAGNDVHNYRREYGKDLLMAGGIDKRCLALGREAIDTELQKKIPLAFDGGYLPTLDHSIPPNVVHDSFQYYWERKKQLLGV
ncbi:MAG: hypothetical protein HY318_20295 [Armatimonadetes bacterium]|nr:hypothetical protein [Armatimonadota bacterium]